MTDDRDICERLEDTNYDGAFAMRREAAKLIRQLRYYTDRLEDDLREADLEAENLRKHISKQQLDIVVLRQEAGRMREALEKIANGELFQHAHDYARAALGEEKRE
jgi:predicted  nucleic acid-binding Zn-ribbon protein